MKIKSFLIFNLFFVVAYVAAVFVLPFLSYTFEPPKPKPFDYVFAFFIKFPFNPTAEDRTTNQFVAFTLLDGFFWGILVYLLIYLIMKLIGNLKRKKVGTIPK